MISKDCEKCAFYEPRDERVPCSLKGASIKCTLLKKYLKKLKFKELI